MHCKIMKSVDYYLRNELSHRNELMKVFNREYQLDAVEAENKM